MLDPGVDPDMADLGDGRAEEHQVARLQGAGTRGTGRPSGYSARWIAGRRRTPQPSRRQAARATGPGCAPEWTIAVTIISSLVLAVGGGYVFYASIRPVSIAEGYGSVLFDFPWILAYWVLTAAWAGGR
jgi:hypothetical protein